jgi:hypothetical protein
MAVNDPSTLPTDASGLLGPEPDLLGELTRWAAEARVDEAAAARARERRLRDQAAEDSSLTGVLIDLAERSTPVVLHTIAGRRHRGVIRLVGADFCGLRAQTGRDVLVSTAALSAVRTEPRGVAPRGDRSVRADLLLIDALGELANERARVLVLTVHTTEGISGELRGIGTDLVRLLLDGEPRATVFVPAAAIAEVSLA